MKNLKDAKAVDAKAVYESIVIPDELEGAVQEAVRRAGRRDAAVPLRHVGWRYAVCAVASICLVFIVSLNALPVFAQEMYDIPVLGGMARIFTLGRFEEADESSYIRVEIPALSETGNDELEKRINYEVALKVDRVVTAAKERAKGYYDAYIATGGDKEEFLPMEIVVEYAVHCNNGEWVSFVVTEYETHASFYSESYYYNIDLDTGKELSLANLLGEDYIDKVNQAVREGIARREAADPDASFFHDELGFTTIAPDQAFYINEAGNPVVVFEKYAIAPGYMGELEFEVVP